MNEEIFYLIFLPVLVAYVVLARPFKRYIMYKLGIWPKPSWLNERNHHE